VWAGFAITVFAIAAAIAHGQASGAKIEANGKSDYVFGPDDEFKVDALDAPELSNIVFRVDNGGFVGMPLVGRIRVAGLTSSQLEQELVGRLKEFVRNPSVTASIKEFRSQPVAVLGAVNAPGSFQIRGGKRLTEVLAQAGGLRSEAGYRLRVTRPLSSGRIPLPSAADDPSGEYSIADIPIKALVGGDAPSEDIQIRPHDLITVPRGELIYVVGDVQKSGGYMLGDSETMSVLQALSLAGGLMPTSAPKNTRLLRMEPGKPSRNEIAVDLKAILAGKSGDLTLKPDDILFVPSNTGKKVALRVVEAAIQAGTGVTIFRAGGRY
jgi:polysaccharide export outer membrane protein